MIKRKIIYISLFAFILIVALPQNINAKTLKDFENEVTKYTNELQEKKDKVAKNDQEVAEIKKKISEIEGQIEKAEKEIDNLQKEIDESNKKIEAKEKESKNLMKYFQVVSNDNTYLEYIFGATSITDMIYRVSVVEQLTDYNEQIMNELEALIKENNQKQQELDQKNKELKELQESLEDQKERINADTATLKAGMPGIEEQIKEAKAQVSQLKKMGCGSNEDIATCTARYYAPSSSGGSGSGGSSGGSLPSTNGFYRPIEYGYITQWYKGRSHMGVDMSSSNKSIPVYPIASGQVSARYYDSAGALVVKIRHNYNGRIIYSTYAHLRNFAVSTGQTVTPYTTIGNMGSTGNSTGPHLHLEITSCDWKSPGGGCTWSTYQNSTYNPTQFVTFPSSWTNR